MTRHVRCGLVAAGFWSAAAGSAWAENPYNLYWGNFHSHSTLSDGIGAPATAFIYARDTAQIDILALSDHTHMLTATEWNTLGALADTYTEDGSFVAMRSQEFGNLNDFGHLNIHGAELRNPNATTNLPATYQFILDQAALGVFNHPNPSYGTWFDNLAYYPEFKEAMRGMEVVNGLYSDDYEGIWIQALNNGWKLAPYGNQDNHEEDWGNRPNPNDGFRIYLTGVYAESLTTSSVLKALYARRVFATEERPEGDFLRIDFELNGQQMGSEVVVEAPSINLEAKLTSLDGVTLCNRIDLFKDGVIVQSHVEIGTQIARTFVDTGLLPGEQHYYFVRGRQTDGDFAWSAPIWITVEEGSSSVASSGRTFSAKPLPNRPNPFTPETDIRFVLPPASGTGEHQVHLTIHDPSGRKVRDLGARTLSPGEHEWTWDGRDDTGDRVSSGVYLYRLEGDGVPPISGRMILLDE